MVRMQSEGGVGTGRKAMPRGLKAAPQAHVVHLVDDKHEAMHLKKYKKIYG